MLLSFITNAQNLDGDYEGPNRVEQKIAYFYKNSWKPFTGNILSEDKDLKLISKIKIINGYETLTEVYNHKNELVRWIKNGVDVEIPKNSAQKTEFLASETFTNLTDIKYKTVVISYSENFETGEKLKFTGVVSFNTTKQYYKDGIIIKVENFYDEDLEKIKERYALFYTELGNLEYADEDKIFDGPYKKWDEKGNIIESGIYKLGQKVK